MKRNLFSWCVASLFPFAAIASDHDFNQAVSSIEQTYHVHRQHTPMIGFAGFAARVATGGSVRGIEIATFDDDSRLPEGADMASLVKGTLGASWSMIVETRSSGEQDAVYARPHGQRMTLLVASYDHGDLSVVQVDLNAKEFQKWMADPVGHARHGETD
jgi:hypothetical protein